MTQNGIFLEAKGNAVVTSNSAAPWRHELPYCVPLLKPSYIFYPHTVALNTGDDYNDESQDRGQHKCF